MGKLLDAAMKPRVKEPTPDLPEKVPGALKSLGRLTAEEYWEWRTTVEELMHAQTRSTVAQKDCRIKELETALLRRDWTERQRMCEAAKAEYDRFKKKLEDIHGFSLENTSIEPTNFEVRLLKEENE